MSKFLFRTHAIIEGLRNRTELALRTLDFM